MMIIMINDDDGLDDGMMLQAKSELTIGFVGRPLLTFWEGSSRAAIMVMSVMWSHQIIKPIEFEHVWPQRKMRV